MTIMHVLLVGNIGEGKHALCYFIICMQVYFFESFNFIFFAIAHKFDFFFLSIIV
jgi:hypothetical protein